MTMGEDPAGVHAARTKSESATSPKINKNTVLNALGKQDVGPLRQLYDQSYGALGAENRSRLQHSFLSKTAVLEDGAPVLRAMSSSQFSRLFSPSALPPGPSGAGAAASKRSEPTWDDLRRLATYLCDGNVAKDAGSAVRGHSFYHAWLDKALSGLRQQHSMRTIVAGTYLLYRPSVAFPGRYVVGLLVIYVTSDNAVATYELNRLRPPTTQNPSNSFARNVESLNIEEEHHGYALRKSGTLLIRSWEESSGEEQAGVFSLLNDDHKKYTHVIEGHYLGVLSTSGPTSRPVVLLRQGDCPSPLLDRDELLDFLQGEDVSKLLLHVGIAQWDDLPPIVCARLARAAGSMAIYDVPRAHTEPSRN